MRKLCKTVGKTVNLNGKEQQIGKACTIDGSCHRSLVVVLCKICDYHKAKEIILKMMENVKVIKRGKVKAKDKKR